jgi:hypothetical protein
MRLPALTLNVLSEAAVRLRDPMCLLAPARRDRTCVARRFTMRGALDRGWVMGHFALSMPILLAAAVLSCQQGAKRHCWH